MYPWQKLLRDDRWTNNNSNCQLIDIVRIVTGWYNRQTHCGGCYAWLTVGWGGRRKDVTRCRTRICERLDFCEVAHDFGLILGAI